MIRLPRGKRPESHAPRLGKSEKGVYCVFRYARDAFQIWFLDVTSRHMERLLKQDINFEHVPNTPSDFIGGSRILQGNDKNRELWTLQGNDKNEKLSILQRIGKDEGLVEDNFEWDPDNKDVVSVEDWVEKFGSNLAIDFLGFHPYKEIALFGSNRSVMAYHLNTSKVRHLGHIPMGNNEIEVS